MLKMKKVVTAEHCIIAKCGSDVISVIKYNISLELLKGKTYNVKAQYQMACIKLQFTVSVQQAP